MKSTGNEPMTKNEYRQLYPDVTSCPECEDDAAFSNGVCFFCVCGCPLCEGEMTDQEFAAEVNRRE